MCIVTGPRIDLAITLIDRMKRLFIDKGLVTFDRLKRGSYASFCIEIKSLLKGDIISFLPSECGICAVYVWLRNQSIVNPFAKDYL
jgi:hypothetical protein